MPDSLERAILIGLHSDMLTAEENADWDSLDELEALLTTAGGVCVGKVLQNHAPVPRTMIGEGKLREITELAAAQEAELLIFDNPLTPSQFHAIEEDSGLRVMDRSGLILDIFASRARTREGKLQVELAQYQYLLPRLAGLGNTLSRLGGGIGTRGPGETKLETDRRHIRGRIRKLESELEDVRRTRSLQRGRRRNQEIPVIALIGYTNAGKSSLLNALTESDIPANDRLFDTLDPTFRRLQVSDTLEVLIADTVGFIRKLPHQLIDAFRATLEELEYAQLLLHVIDLSNTDWASQAAVTEDMIRQLHAESTPVITVFNKADLVKADFLPHGDDIVTLSAKTGEGLADLKVKIETVLQSGIHHIMLLLPYSEAGRLDILYRDGRVEHTEYTNEGIEVSLWCDSRTFGWARAFIRQELT